MKKRVSSMAAYGAILIVWNGLAMPALRAAEPKLPALAAYRVQKAPFIDGKLDDPCWAEAQVGSNFWKSDGSGPVDNSAGGRIAYDDNNLYVAMHCPLKNQEEVKAAKALARDALFGHDTVEIFLEPFADNAAYFHFAVNAVNGRFAAMNFGYAWSNPWQSATKIDADGWNAEIRIPFASFATNDGKPSPNWRFNMTRGATTWAPTFVRYHQPELFGHLTGIQAPLEDYRWHTAVGTGNAVGDPSINLELYHNTGQTRKVKYSLQVSEPGGNGKPWNFTANALTLAPLTSKMVEVPIPALVKPQAYDVLVSITEADTGRVLSYNTTSIEGPRPAQTVWNRSFFMNEQAALLSIACSGKGAMNANLVANLRAQGKQVVLQSVPVRLNVQGKGQARFGLKALPAGNYEVILKGKNGYGLDATASSVLQKLTLKPGAVQFTDRGILLRDGKPIFPTGVYYVRQGFPVRPGLMDEYAQAGFNTYPMEWTTAGGFIQETNQQKSRGVVPIIGISNSAELQAYKYQGPQTLDAWVKATHGLVKEVSSKAGDNILAWYTWDEPPLGIWYDLTKRLHQATRQEDPYHPTMVVSNNPAIFKSYAADATDILAIDPYPGFPGGRMRVVSDWMDAALQATEKPVFAVLQAFYEPSGRMPTADELRCMTYLSIVHGAKGVLYFSYNYQPGPMPEYRPETWQSIKDLGKEMQLLGPSIVANPTNTVSVMKKAGDGIDFKICGDYLIAVNGESTAMSAVFEITSKKKIAANFTVFNENRTVSLKNGRLSDNFAPYGVHIYKIQ